MMTPRWPFVVLLASVAIAGVRVAPESTDSATTRAVVSARAGEAGSPPSRGPVHPDPPEPELSSTWYCAAGTVEGPAGHEVTISNPTDEPVRGELKLFSEEAAEEQIWGDTAPGDARELHPLHVPAGGDLRVVLAEVDDPVIEGAGEGDVPASFVAALLELDGEVTVEHRVEGALGSAEGALGSAEGPCATGGSSEWHFAWGATTRDAEDMMVLFNPFPNDVVVDASFVTGEGVREPLRWQGLVVPAGRAVVVEVGADVTRRDHVAASIRARSGSLIVERLHLFDGSLGTEGLWLAAGHPEPSTTTQVLPGEALGEDDNELTALYNPGEETAEVEVQVLPATGGDEGEPEAPRPFRFVVRPRQVRVLDFSEESRIDAVDDHVTVVESTNGVPVVAQQVVLPSPR